MTVSGVLDRFLYRGFAAAGVQFSGIGWSLECQAILQSKFEKTLLRTSCCMPLKRTLIRKKVLFKNLRWTTLLAFILVIVVRNQEVWNLQV